MKEAVLHSMPKYCLISYYIILQVDVHAFISHRGTDELLGVMDKVHIVNSTLGKALGGAAGAYKYQTLSEAQFYIVKLLYHTK